MSTRRRADAGYSLPELLVAMAITSVLLALVAGVFLSDLRTTTRISAKVDSTADARLVADTMARRLRMAVSTDPNRTTPPFSTPLRGDGVTFVASIAGGAVGGPAPGEANPKLTQVQYAVVPVMRDGVTTSCVRETLTPGTSTQAPITFPAAGAVSRCLAFGAVNADGQPLLTYFTSGTGTDATTSAGAVRSVRVSVVITSTRGDQRASTTATTRVSLPNVCTVGAQSC